MGRVRQGNEDRGDRGDHRTGGDADEAGGPDTGFLW